MGKGGKRNLPVPVTLLSGFLGGGKTTLLKHILEHNCQKDTGGFPTGLRIAVLVNDLAKVNIDAALIKNTKMISSEEKMLELHNGCICCTLREDLLVELTKLAIEGADDIDAIIIESTGVSEPQQVAETFTFPFDPDAEDDHEGHDHGDEGHSHEKTEVELKKEQERVQKLQEIQDVIDKAAAELGHAPTNLNEIARLDTCVTVVDCQAFSGDLTSAESLIERYRDKEGEVGEEDDRNVATLLMDQLEFANVVLLNKTDLVSAEQVARIRKAVQVLNPLAKVCTTQHSKVDLRDVVNTNLFSMEAAERSTGWLKSMQEEILPETEEYGIGSFVYRARAPFHPKRLVDFLKSIFFVEMVIYDDDEEEEEDEDTQDKKTNGDKEEEQDQDEKPRSLFGKGTFEERDEAAAKIFKNMKENYGHIYRSKGFLWIAGRDLQHGEWSQAGTIGEITVGDMWLGLYPRELLPEEDSQEWQAMKADFQDGMIQDRRQEIVIIGSDLNKARITEELDRCLLTKQENVKDLSKWEIPERFTQSDLDANFWKFGWKPQTEEEDPLPKWPGLDDLKEEEDEEEEGKEKKAEK